MFGHNIARKWCFLSLRAERATVSLRSAIVKLVTLAEENQWKGGQKYPFSLKTVISSHLFVVFPPCAQRRLMAWALRGIYRHCFQASRFVLRKSLAILLRKARSIVCSGQSERALLLQNARRTVGRPPSNPSKRRSMSPCVLVSPGMTAGPSRRSSIVLTGIASCQASLPDGRDLLF